MSKRPRYKHDCEECYFLGTILSNNSDHDLYCCVKKGPFKTVIARYGSDGPDYESGLLVALQGQNVRLEEALRRAIDLKLISPEVTYPIEVRKAWKGKPGDIVLINERFDAAFQPFQFTRVTEVLIDDMRTAVSCVWKELYSKDHVVLEMPEFRIYQGRNPTYFNFDWKSQEYSPLEGYVNES